MKTVATCLTAAALTAALSAGIAHAKLPPPSEEAQAAAAAAKAKADWGAKVAAYQLCQAQNRVAANFGNKDSAKNSGAALPACADPGPFSPAAPAAAATSSAAVASPATTPVKKQ